MSRQDKKHREQFGNPLLSEERHDPYRAKQKISDNTKCPECAAVYMKGRWTWNKIDNALATDHLCPACQRIKDQCPAGEIRLSGNFLAKHRDEMLDNIRKLAKSVGQEHPLHRIIDIEDDGNTIVCSTTDIHLPHQIGHALTDAWGGEMNTHYDQSGYFSRVMWQRDD